jgi:hypothetical protein
VLEDIALGHIRSSERRIDLAIERIYAHHLYANFLDSLLSAINDSGKRTGNGPNASKNMDSSMSSQMINILKLIFQTSGLGTQEEANFIIMPCFVANEMAPRTPSNQTPA